MINCNPETVSTDYDTANRLYFEPLTFEDVMAVYQAELAVGPVKGMFVQLGGQTPLSLAQRLADAGVPILGTSPEAIDNAEDRAAFGRVLSTAGLPAPDYGTAHGIDEALEIAGRIGYPVLVRPSYVLGGRGMEIVYSSEALVDYHSRVKDVGDHATDAPLLIDRFLDDAIEIDVDAIFDGTDLFLGGVMEHIEEAGIHSGDSACVIPPVTLSQREIERVAASTRALAEGIGVRGLMNVQFALAANVLYVLEANPRASRTVPFVAKATGVPLAKAASLVMAGATIAQLKANGVLPEVDATVPQGSPLMAVKEAVLPFKRFRTHEGHIVDSVLGPEMRSTGEVMGMDLTFPLAFAKSQSAAIGGLPTSGRAFVSVADRDKRSITLAGSRLHHLGFEILAPGGTAQVLARNGIPTTPVRKYADGTGPHGEPTIVDLINQGQINLVVYAGLYEVADGEIVELAVRQHQFGDSVSEYVQAFVLVVTERAAGRQAHHAQVDGVAAFQTCEKYRLVHRSGFGVIVRVVGGFL
jgi:carbamoyl-phosphate synthase large subunit